MKRVEIGLLCLLLIAAFSVRLYKINRPIGDWHSWRQADTAAVARNFVKEGFNPLIPKFDDMSSQANGLDNPNRYRFVEFPVYNSIIAGVWAVFGVNQSYARMVTVFVTLGSTLFLYLIVKRFSGWKIALLAASFFAFIPYNVFYSSVVLPGPLMVLFLLVSYYFFELWLRYTKNWFYFCLSAVSLSLAVLSWPIALMFTIPFLYLAYDKYKLKSLQNPSLWVFAFIALAPFALWRLWIARFPEGIPDWQFLLNEGGIRFKGAFFRWIFSERLGRLILTVAGIPLLLFGLIKKPGREGMYYLSFMASTLLYLCVFASGNIRHDYYQVPIIPTLAIFLAIGTYTLFNLPKENFNRVLGQVAAMALIIFMAAFGYYEVKGYYWINKSQIVEAGKAVDRLLPKDATVIAPYIGDTAFLYQTNRHGYPVVDRPLEKFIEQGTVYLVSVDVDDAGIKNLADHCNVIEKTSGYVIVEMQKDCIGK